MEFFILLAFICIVLLGCFVLPLWFRVKDLEASKKDHNDNLIDLWRDLHILQKEVKTINAPVVTDKVVVLAEEPQLDDAIYRQESQDSFTGPVFNNGYPAWDKVGAWKTTADRVAMKRVKQYG